MTNSVDLVSLSRLINTLKDDEVVQNYLAMGNKVHQNAGLVDVYEQYIAKQKEIVKLQQYKKNNAVAIADAQLKEIEEELFSNPLFNNYMSTQIELNELFQEMTFLIEEKVNKHLSEN